KLFPLASRASELVVVVFEQYVERSQRAVRAGDVLLQRDFVFVRDLLARIDFLLEHAEPVADHHDLAEESLDGYALFLDALFAGAKTQLAAAPSVTDRCVGQSEFAG